MVRDMAGLEVHPETLTKTTGVELDSDNPIVIRDCTLDDVYVQMYQTAILNHLQQLIRVLELHYNGLGWEILRQQLRKNIPEDHPLYSAWILPDRKTYPASCHLRRQLLANEWVGLLTTKWKT